MSGKPTLSQLTKHIPGSFKELFSLSAPLFFAFVSSSLMSFCDRYFLSHYSLEAFKAASIASYLSFFFQVFCIKLTAINQVFVGKSLGKESLHQIGPYTWQMIWCSLFTIILIFPISDFVGYLYFANTEVEKLGQQYFSIMILGNFLFPLGAALAAFQMGLGKNQVLIFVTLVANLLNFLLDYLLIYGISGLLPALGVTGAAIATIISQTFYCLILFYLFLRHPFRKVYHIKDFRFQLSLFWESLCLGFPRAFSTIWIFLFWLLAVNLITKRGGDYVLVISLGSTLWSIFTVISQSVGTAITSLFSYFLGQNNWTLIWKCLRAGMLCVSLAFCFFAIPLVVLNRQLIQIMIGIPISQETMHYLSLGCYWLWIYLLLDGLLFLTSCLLIAMRQSKYILKQSILVTGLATYLPFYIGFVYGDWNPDKIWMATWPCCIIAGLSYLIKIRCCYRESRMINPEKLSTSSI